MNTMFMSLQTIGTYCRLYFNNSTVYRILTKNVFLYFPNSMNIHDYVYKRLIKSLADNF